MATTTTDVLASQILNGSRPFTLNNDSPANVQTEERCGDRAPALSDEAEILDFNCSTPAGAACVVRFTVDSGMPDFPAGSIGYFRQEETPRDGDLVLVEYFKRSRPFSLAFKLSSNSRFIERFFDWLGVEAPRFIEHSAIAIRRYVVSEQGPRFYRTDQASYFSASELEDVELAGVLTQISVTRDVLRQQAT